MSGDQSVRGHDWPHRLSTSVIDEVIAHARNGEPASKIARDFRLNINTVLKYGNSAGISFTELGKVAKREALRTLWAGRHRERDDAIVGWWSSGLRRDEIGPKVGVSYPTVCSVLHRRGIESARRLGKPAWLERGARLYAKGHSLAEVAQMVGLSSTGVSQGFHRHGVKTRTVSEHAMLKQQDRDRAILHWWREGMSVREVSQKVDASRYTVWRVLRRAGKWQRFRRRKIDPVSVVRVYRTGVSVPAIARRFGLSTSYPRVILLAEGEPLRNASAAGKLIGNERNRRAWETRRSKGEVPHKWNLTPDERRRRIDAIRAGMAEPSVLEKLSRSSRQRWSNPNFRARHADSVRRALAEPSIKEKQREGLRRAWANPERKTRWVASIRRGIDLPETRARMSAGQIVRHQGVTVPLPAGRRGKKEMPGGSEAA